MDPLRVAVIGCGEAGEQKHLRALSTLREVRVMAIADESRAALDRAGERLGIARRFTSLDDLLGDPEVEAVGVCVPPAVHVRIATACLEAGKHVLVEKPLALGLVEAVALARLARESAGRAVMGSHMRFHRIVRAARDLVATGALGEIESIRSVWSSPRGDEDLPAWRWRRELGGGSLVELAVHHFDLWRFVTGRHVVDVMAQSRSGTRDDESAIVSGRLEGGVLASVQCSERGPHQVEIEIVGDRGWLRADCLRYDGIEWTLSGVPPGGVRMRIGRAAKAVASMPRAAFRARTGGDYLDSYRGQWRHLREVVRHDARVESSLDDGVAALRVVLAATESERTGRPVQVASCPAAIAPRGAPVE